MWIHPGVPQHQQEIGVEIFEPKSSHGKRAHEAAPPWHTKLDPQDHGHATIACH
jgi:hypothetical protein